MKKILLLSAAACMFSFVHAEDGDSAGGHGFYVGGGFLLCNSGERVEHIELGGYNDLQADGYPTRLGGTLLVGYQAVPSSYPVCIGFEIGSDFMPRKEEHNAGKVGLNNAESYDLRTSRNGFTPFAAIRIGYINHEHKFMPYIKFGISYEKSVERYTRWHIANNALEKQSDIKLTSWMPTVALGLEKSIGKDITGRIEGEYRFAKSKTTHFTAGDAVKFTQKGTLNIRALVCYNVKI